MSRHLPRQPARDHDPPHELLVGGEPVVQRRAALEVSEKSAYWLTIRSSKLGGSTKEPS
jgi:hypothetical protein